MDVFSLRTMLATLLLAVASTTTSLKAQTYDQMWKQVDEAMLKDLPRTQMDLLGKICEKASRNNDYGQLLAAGLRRASLQVQVSPDSLEQEVARLTALAAEYERRDAVLAAVAYAVLGKIYRNNDALGEDSRSKSDAFFDKALAGGPLLAARHDSDYLPLIIKGQDSDLFGNDLLHVIGMEAERYAFLRDHYAGAGNRQAACIMDLMRLKAERDGRTRSEYIGGLDSLIEVYGDLPVAAEVAEERLQRMEGGNGEKYHYGRQAVERWGSWRRIAAISNVLAQITTPKYSVSYGDNVLRPGDKRTVRLSNVTNLKSLTLKTWKLKGNGENINKAYSSGGMDKVKKLASGSPVQTMTRTFDGYAEWEEASDSMTIEGLQTGVYLLEMSADNTSVEPQYEVLYVSDVFLIWEEMPEKTIRYVAVSAATGRPLPRAWLRITEGRRWDSDGTTQTYRTDSNGELLYTYTKYRPSEVFAYTESDNAAMPVSVYSSYSYSRGSDGQDVLRVYTDRSIYRPGQTLHAAVVSYRRYNRNSYEAKQGERLTLTLSDANYQKVAEKTVTTDDFGTAAADFLLPTAGLTGTFTVTARGTVSSTARVRMEEYKRPTFELDFPEYEEKYAAGDTVRVKAYARTFAGVPVQGAKVRYSVTRRNAHWCWWAYTANGDEQLFEDVTTTDSTGAFYMTVPLVLPKTADLYDDGLGNKYWRRGLFYNFTARADVTDQGGESHTGECSLPLGTRMTSLSSNLPEKSLRDSLKSVSYTFRNAAGTQINGSVRLTIDGKPYGGGKSFPANTPIVLQPLSSGRHVFEAVCSQDTIRQDVVVFSMTDKTPVVDTHDWFYISSNEFPADGSPVYVQFGASDADQHVVYAMFSANEVIESGRLDQSNSLTTIALKYRQSYGDGIRLTYAWVRNGTLYQHSEMVRKAQPDRRLRLNWKTFRDRLTPGQQEEWTLTVTDPSGKPANAQLMATLYDHALDQIRPHTWGFSLSEMLSISYASWGGQSAHTIGSGYSVPAKLISVNNMRYSRLDEFNLTGLMYESPVIVGYGGRNRLMRMSQVLNSKAVMLESAPVAMAVMDAAADADAGDGLPSAEVKIRGAAPKTDTSTDEEVGSSGVQMRENLNETAFFYPQLHTDDNGCVAMKFTLPESLTTWHFMGFAHDRRMNYGSITADAVAQKTVMVMPNVPRFVRQGDKPAVLARLVNTSDHEVTGVARLELVDPQNDKVVFTAQQPFSIAANGTSASVLGIATEALVGRSLLVVRVMAQGDGYSDGEQHYLPVLSNCEQVLNTIPFTQHGAGDMSINVEELIPDGTENQYFTVEYTNHPSWLMIQALPYVGDANVHNAVSLASAYYANKLGQKMMMATPRIKQTIEAWRSEAQAQPIFSLDSELSKNNDLKELVLSETPWVLDASRESEQRHNLINFFDQNAMNQRLESVLSHMERLQNSDGSWSWWEGMSGSMYMTTAVSKALVRLNVMIGEQEDTRNMLRNAFKYMSGEIGKEVVELKKLERKGIKGLHPSEIAVDYLYLCALSDRKLSGSAQSDIAYLVGLLSKKTSELSIYGKAVSAVILAHNNYKKKAAEYLQSIKEYSVYTEEMGRYYDTRKALYSWRDYRIPTEVAAIEALRALTPEDKQTVEEMQRWLLQEKRTQAWDTPVNAVDAVYAFFGSDGIAAMAENTGSADISIDGQPLKMSQATAGLGVVSGHLSGSGNHSVLEPRPKTVTVRNTDADTSWGTVYAKFLQPVKDISDRSAGITVTREIIPVTNGSSPVSSQSPALSKGSRVKVRITITAERDYDFVQVTDRRAACMEPVGQLSGYRWGYYCAPKDCSTNYYFDRLAKGKHVVETEYYIDREGDYQSGSCTVQCAYAPGFYGRAKGYELTIDD